MADTEALRLHPWLPLVRLPDQTVRIHGSETAGVVPAGTATAVLGTARRVATTGSAQPAHSAAQTLTQAGVIVARDRVARAAAAGRHIERAFLSRHVRDPAGADVVVRRSDWIVRLTGDGPLTDEVTGALVACGLSVTSGNRPDPRPGIAVHVGRPSAAAIHDWMAAGTPHLIVSARPTSVRVGPLVQPAVTACLQCLHLARTERDPSWPWLAERLTHCPIAQPDPLLTLAAASLAARVIVGFVEAAQDRSADCYWVTDLDDPVPRRRSVARHPACGCWWPLLKEEMRQ